MSEDQDVVLSTNNKKRTSEKPKVSMSLKRAWHAACFQPRDRKGSDRKWRKAPGMWMSLKSFAKQNEFGSAWFANKLGEGNSKRSEQNIARIAAEKTASRSARK